MPMQWWSDASVICFEKLFFSDAANDLNDKELYKYSENRGSKGTRTGALSEQNQKLQTISVDVD